VDSGCAVTPNGNGEGLAALLLLLPPALLIWKRRQR
jgi:hypothetical protein